jgi:hypothetical protein
MIKDALILQKREVESRVKEGYIGRRVKTPGWDNDLIKVIIGPRRAGKSFFAVHELSKRGNFGYANFDDEALSEVTDYNEVIDGINEVYDTPKCLLFDEIQNLPKWELFVNRLQRQGYDLVITGSNSNLLSKELSTHLTGRHTLITILPLSFKEYLGDAKKFTTSEIKSRLSKYVAGGGYPEPLVKNLDYKEYLSTLFDSIVYKDIVKRFSIRSPNAIENLARYLVSNISQEYSYNSLARLSKCKSSRTIEKYLGYLEEAFVFFKLDRFSFKVREQVSSNKKIYCVDNGFIHAKAFNMGANMGRLYENCVAVELKRSEYSKRAEVYFWKNVQQEEVDFVVKEGRKVTRLIQVCYDIRDVEVKEREVRAILKAAKELKCKNLVVITGDYEAEKDEGWFGIKGRIRYVPLWKWLLENGMEG